MLSKRNLQRLVAARQRLAHEGWTGFLRNIYAKRTGQKKIDPIAEFSFVLNQHIDPPPSDIQRNTVNWVVPPFHPGAGGHTTIFRFVQMLEARGYTCRVVVDDGFYLGSAEHFRSTANQHFFPLQAAFYSSLADAPPAEFTVATAWMTAYKVKHFSATRHRVYFVQDFEPWFYPVGSQHELALQSYRLGLFGITAGGWLKQKLGAEFSMPAEAIGFSYDRQVYKSARSTPPSHRRVFFYARPSTSRRAFELGLLALHQLSLRLPDVHVVMAGGDISQYHVPFAHTSHGVVSVEQLAAIYNTCDTALVISLTNLSLLPLELMACGVPIVSNRGPWTEWLLSSEHCMLADATPTALSDALHDCLTLREQTAAMAERGMAFAQSTSWEHEGDRFAAALAALAHQPLAAAN